MSEPKSTATVSLARVLSLMIGGALILAFISWYWWPDHIALASLRLWLPLWSVTVFTYGFANTEKPIQWLRKWLRYTRLEMFKIGGGFYAAVAAALFITMEAQRFLQGTETLMTGKVDWVGMALSQLVGFSVDSFLNGIYAAAWPGFLTKTLGFHNVWWSLGPALALYWLALKALNVDESATAKKKDPVPESE